MSSRTCLVLDCDRKYYCKGYCELHWKRWRVTGDPLVFPSEGKLHGRHGGTHAPEYQSWKSMKSRCFNKNRNSSKNYMLRGITVCVGWKNSFKTFRQDMGERPEGKYSIDRIDNDGHYSCGHCEECLENGWPMNCRWATPAEQSRNQRPKRNKTGYTGVTERAGRFFAGATIGGKWKYVGSFSTAEEAHQAYLVHSERVSRS